MKNMMRTFIGGAAVLFGLTLAAGCADRSMVTTGEQQKAPAVAVQAPARAAAVPAPPSEPAVPAAEPEPSAAATPPEEKVVEPPQPIAAASVENEPPPQTQEVVAAQTQEVVAAVAAIAAEDLADVYFDFDRFGLTSTAKETLTDKAGRLKGRDRIRVLIEGHCDERGTRDYNMLLGEQRAQAVKRYLEELGLPGSRIETVSYGKEKPFCAERKHACWRQNRRAHLVVEPAQ